MRKFAVLAIALALFVSGCALSALPEGVAADGRPYRGAESAKLTIYEYSDFQCPFCDRARQNVDEVLRVYPDSVRLEYRYFPLSSHPRGYASALAGACAEEQGKFWKMHDLMFDNQEALEDADLEKYALQSGMDLAAFRQCLSSAAAAGKVNSDKAQGEQLGVQGTPTFFIGQSAVVGAQPVSKFRSAIDSELARIG
jgi:protein-disulfide isomerase